LGQTLFLHFQQAELDTNGLYGLSSLITNYRFQYRLPI
jgi:hypothetical protein